MGRGEKRSVCRAARRRGGRARARLRGGGSGRRGAPAARQTGAEPWACDASPRLVAPLTSVRALFAHRLRLPEPLILRRHPPVGRLAENLARHGLPRPVRWCRCARRAGGVALAELVIRQRSARTRLTGRASGSVRRARACHSTGAETRQFPARAGPASSRGSRLQRCSCGCQAESGNSTLAPRPAVQNEQPGPAGRREGLAVPGRPKRVGLPSRLGAFGREPPCLVQTPLPEPAQRSPPQRPVSARSRRACVPMALDFRSCACFPVHQAAWASRPTARKLRAPAKLL